jgi:hypothetical protein
MKKNLMKLNLEKFNFNENKYKIPFLYETWTWEGDESVLPFKWIDLIKNSDLLEKKNEQYDFDKINNYLKDNYYGLNTFDKLSFFFITNRSEVTGCAYLNKLNCTIDYFLVNKKFFGNGVENGLFNLIYNRAIELKLNSISINLELTNINENFFNEIGFIKL